MVALRFIVPQTEYRAIVENLLGSRDNRSKLQFSAQNPELAKREVLYVECTAAAAATAFDSVSTAPTGTRPHSAVAHRR
jgi:hypothetical protein